MAENSSLGNKAATYQPVDPAAFSAKELKWSFWFVKNKLLLKKIGIIALVVLDIFLVAYPLYGFVSYFVLGRSIDTAAVTSLSQRLQKSSVQKLSTAAPAPLLLEEPIVFDNGNSRFDFVVSVENPNPNWAVILSYAFAVEGASSTAARTSYLLPGEKKFLSILGVKREDVPLAATLQINTETWRRINPHQIADVTQFLRERHAFTVSSQQFVAGNASAGELSANRILFSVRNDTAYNFWSVPVQVALYRGGLLVGLEELAINEFRTGEERALDIRNYSKELQVDQVEIIPSVDVFDAAVYMNQ